MTEEVTQSPISAESQIDLHIRENYEQVREERGFTWQQMADRFGSERGGSLLQAWALEMASGKSVGIESRGEVSGDAENADAPRKSKRGNAKGLDPETA